MYKCTNTFFIWNYNILKLRRNSLSLLRRTTFYVGNTYERSTFQRDHYVWNFDIEKNTAL